MSALGYVFVEKDGDLGSGAEAIRGGCDTRGRTAVADPPELSERIAAMRSDGMTLQAIADVLKLPKRAGR
jgi:hypothetical protein